MSAAPDQLPAVRRALRAAFGTETLDGWTPLSGGLSGARLWRIRVGGIAYLLRVETGRDALRDPHRGYRCMALAAEACLAPRVRYADPDDGVAIMDFIEARSLTLDPVGTRAELVVELAQAVRALHAIEGFPPLVDYLEGLNGLVDTAGRAGVVAVGAFDPWPRLRAVCERLDPQPVSSHNDLHPGNVLFDGQRLWLIDFEYSGNNDPTFELGNTAQEQQFTPEQAAEQQHAGGRDHGLREQDRKSVV